MRISDWSSDVCSSDLRGGQQRRKHAAKCWRFGSRSVEYASSCGAIAQLGERRVRNAEVEGSIPFRSTIRKARPGIVRDSGLFCGSSLRTPEAGDVARPSSEEHTYELQSLMRISYDYFCLKKNT